MSSSLPYTTERRPDTGITSPVLGLWLFLASEVMLFGSLLSAYTLLRLGSETWRPGGEWLDPASGALKTALLVASSVTVYVGWERLRGRRRGGRRQLAATLVLGAVFLALKVHELAMQVEAGAVPARDVATAITWVLVSLHGVHVLGGLVVLGYLAGPGFVDDGPRRSLFLQRVELTGTYWHFVDAVWLLLFPLLYLT